MAEGFIGEVKLVAFSYAPRGWERCEGQLLQISSNTALFSVLGLKYGGDGRSTFGLPDMRDKLYTSPWNGVLHLLVRCISFTFVNKHLPISYNS